MKSIIRLLLSALLILSVAGCKKEKDASFSISGINLKGVKYLALASKGDGNAKGEDKQQMLYSIDENGNMQLIAYNYLCDDDGLVTEIQRNINITVNQAVPVGDKYIWLVGCRYVCDDYSGFSESMQNRIRDMVNHSIQYTENFLIRKSDGKIFDLNEVIGSFPYCIVNVPGYGRAGLVGIGGFDGIPIDGDITGDRMRKLGLINQHNGDIYLASGSYYGSLSRLHDNGSSISMMSVMPGTADQPVMIAYSVTDSQDHLGTCLAYNGNSPDVAAIMAPDGTLPRIQGIPVAPSGQSNFPEMRCIGNKFFVSAMVNVWDGDNYMGTYDSIYRVDINGSQASATGVARGYFNTSSSSNTVYISDEENYSWVAGSTLYTFNANTYQITENTLPSDWPFYSEFDAEGYCYKPHLGDGLQSFTIYNLATMLTEEVSCNRSQVPAFNFLKDCYYDGGLKAFVESIILANGSTAAIVTPVTGPDRGVSRIQSQTEANNNIVVNTLIPLN